MLKFESQSGQPPVTSYSTTSSSAATPQGIENVSIASPLLKEKYDKKGKNHTQHVDRIVL